MDNKDEVLLSSLLFVSLYLCNTNRVPNAIEMCKEVLFLLQHKTLGNMDEKCVKSFENVNSDSTECCVRPILTSRQVVERNVELITTCILEGLYKSECKYNEAKGLDLKALKIAEKIGDRRKEAVCYGYLGSIFESHGEYVKAQEQCEKALAIAEETGDREIKAICYASLGSIFFDLCEYVKA